MSKLFKATVYVTLLSFVGQGLNFLINSFLASKLGVGREVDCYLNAISLPTYIIVIITGSLSATFIPSFIDVKEERKRINLISSLLFLTLIIGVFISFFLYNYSSEIIKIQAPGFSFELREYCSYLQRKSLWLINLTIVSEIFSGYYYSIKQYLIPVINKIISPIVTILVLALTSTKINASIVITASLIGVLIQNIILLFLYFYRGNLLTIKINFLDKDLKKIIRLMIPLLMGSIFYKILPLFDKYFLSTLPIGSTSIVNYSQRLFLTSTQIIGAGLSMQVLSHMANLVSENNIIEFKAVLNKIFKLILFLTIPITVIIFYNSLEIVKIVFERGLFRSIDSEKVAINLMIYSLAIPTVALGTIVSQGLYVLKQTWAPFIVGILEIVLYISICFALVNSKGVLALPIAYVIYFYFSVFMLQFWLNKKLPYIDLIEIIKTTFKSLIIIFFELFLLYILNNFILNQPTSILFSIPLLFSIYILITYYLKFNEASFIISKIIIKIKK